MKGIKREANLRKEDYYSNEYFKLQQLMSLSHQLNIIWQLKPKKILEIGIGNGFLSTLFRKSGINVVTVDINKNLKPDIVCPLDQLPQCLREYNFDLVVCCEVLEHIPFDEFEKNIEILRQYSNRLFLTLPSYEKWFGVYGFIKIPKKIFNFSFGMRLKVKKNLQNHFHFWELGSIYLTKRKNIKRIIKRYYNSVTHGVFELNPYHEYFICENKK